MGRLVQLELDNFKSYKGKQIIGPFADFTCVVGPNGAGKSNLMEAICFVLGIRTSHLRSEKLKDVIYRGPGTTVESDENRPERASVSALYRHDSGDESTFSRIVSLNNQSEYRINDKVVSFNEYMSRLSKENVLVKARNFLVFQDEVMNTASQPPKALTKRIEQISSSDELIEQYEALRLANEKASENSLLYYNKKRSIAAELKQYREQIEDAQRFRDRVDEKRKVELEFVLWTLFHTEKSIKHLETELKGVHKEVDVAERRQKEAETLIVSKKQEQGALHKDTLNVERDIMKKEQALDEQRPLSLQIQEQLLHGRRKLRLSEESLDTSRAEVTRQSTHLTQLELELNQVKNAARLFEDQIQMTEASEQNIQLDEAMMQKYNDMRKQVEKQTVHDQQELTTVSRTLKSEHAAVDRLVENIAGLVRHQQHVTEERTQLLERQSKTQQYLSDTRQEIDTCQQQLDALAAHRRTLSEREARTAEELTHTLRQLMDVKADKRQSEREKRLQESLDTLRKMHRGVHGRVRDLLTSTQRRYDLAITTLLAPQADAIVVDDVATAKACIEYMREHRVGMATFLPLDSLAVKPAKEPLRALSHARLAIDVVQYAPVLEKAALFVCKSTLLCDSLAVARDYAFSRREKCVTLEGQVIHKSGLMSGSGGGQSNTSSSSSLVVDVDVLRRQRDTLMAEMTEMAHAKRALPSEDALLSQLAGLETRRAQTAREIQLLGEQLMALEEDLQTTRRQCAAMDRERSEKEEALVPLQSAAAAIQARIEVVEDAVFADFCQTLRVSSIREYEDRQLKKTREMAERRLQFAAQQSRLENMLDFERGQAQDTQQRVDRMTASVRAEETRLRALESEAAQLTVAMETHSQALAGLRSVLQGARRRYDDKAAEIRELKQGLERHLEMLDQLRKQLLNKEAELEKARDKRHSVLRRCKMEQMTLPLLRGDLQQWPDHLRSGSDPSDAPVLEPDYSRLNGHLKKHGGADIEAEFIEQLRHHTAEIEKMAPNRHALEEVADMERRLEDTHAQFELARQESRVAKDAFQAVKQERYRRFNAAFMHVASEIDRIYKQLTASTAYPHGGTAYLSVENTEEPYLEGVKYHAMPPMKRFRDMEQLSGGEKAVAAVALLFAMHTYRPSPFFVLDEIDGPLDNMNVAMVTYFLKTQPAMKQTQLIVISHKHALYEKSDALVGVYRDQQVPSSRILTLDLVQYDQQGLVK